MIHDIALMNVCAAPQWIRWDFVSPDLRLFILTISVPNVYPVDLFEHLWVVDRLERLGIARYFQREIEHCMDYVDKFCFTTFLC